EPNPAAAETAETGGFKLGLEIVKAAEGGLDVVGEFAGRCATGVRADYFPEKGMVAMATAVVAHCAANVFRDGREILDEFANRFGFQSGITSNGLVQVGDIGGVMLVMVDFHRERVEMRFERSLGVGQGR